MDNRYPRPGSDNKISSDIIVNEFGGIQKIADGLKSNMKVSIINIHFSSFMSQISKEIMFWKLNLILKIISFTYILFENIDRNRSKVSFRKTASVSNLDPFATIHYLQSFIL